MMDDDHAAQVREMQLRLRREHQALDDLDPASAGYEARAAQVLEATDELLDYEARIPAIVEERRRQATSLIVASWFGLTAVAMLILGVVGLIVGVGAWRLALVGVMSAGAMLGMALEGSRPTEGHWYRRASAFMAPVVALWLITIVALRNVLPPAVQILAIPALALMFLLWMAGATNPKHPTGDPAGKELP